MVEGKNIKDIKLNSMGMRKAIVLKHHRFCMIKCGFYLLKVDIRLLSLNIFCKLRFK